MSQQNIIIQHDHDWTEGSVGLLRKWERICSYRKKAHYISANSYEWKNKILSIPIIVISTILGSLSFIHPSFIDQSSSSSSRMLQSLPDCTCTSYFNGASSGDDNLCMKIGTTQCYPPNSGDGLCPGDMLACTNIDVPTVAPTIELDGYVPELDNGPDDCCTHTAPWDDQFTLMCQTCAYDVVVKGLNGITYKWYQNGAVQFQLTCASGWGAMAGKAFCSGQNNQNGGTPSYMAICQSSCNTNTPTVIFSTPSPTQSPSPSPTQSPSPSPTESPSKAPIPVPTPRPSPAPSGFPSRYPTHEPTPFPSPAPSAFPTRTPTKQPTTKVPTKLPTGFPSTGYPSFQPSFHPTTVAPTDDDCECCVSGPDMWIPDASPTNPSWTLKSTYLDHTNGGLLKRYECEDMCRGDPQCNSWMWRLSMNTCYLSTDTELKEYRPNPGYNDHHPHEFTRECTTAPTTHPTFGPTTHPTFGPTTPPTFEPTTPPTTKTPTNDPTINEEESEEEIEEPEDGNCAELCGDTECPLIGGGGVGMWDCQCCYQYWHGCSFSYCDVWCYPNCNSSPTTPPPTPSPISSCPPCPSCAPTSYLSVSKSPTIIPTKVPTPLPSKVPTQRPSWLPSKVPTQRPSWLPSKVPTQRPSWLPTKGPTHRPSSTSADCNCPDDNEIEDDNNNHVMFPYIIGAFNMMIAVLSALHTFLKYDALEDRHHQYSRHFGNLQVDLETLLAKPVEQRGNAGTMVERYKIKYTVLINNAPDLSETLERSCCTVKEIKEESGIELAYL